MLVTCERCTTSYFLDEALLRGTHTPVQCTRCGAVFQVQPMPSRDADALRRRLDALNAEARQVAQELSALEQHRASASLRATEDEALRLRNAKPGNLKAAYVGHDGTSTFFIGAAPAHEPERASTPDDAVWVVVESSKLLPPGELMRAKAFSLEHRCALSEALLRLKLVTEPTLLSTFAHRLHLRFVTSTKLAGAPALHPEARTLAAKLRARVHAFPLSVGSTEVFVAVPIGHWRPGLEAELSSLANVPQVRVVLVTEASFSALHRWAEGDSQALARLVTAPSSSEPALPPPHAPRPRVVGQSMLTEVSGVRQEGGLSRRWFTADELELVLWLNAAGACEGFQLCFDKRTRERALTWKRDGGFVVTALQPGPIEPGKTAHDAPVPLGSGPLDVGQLVAHFEAAAAAVPEALRDFVSDRLREHPDYSGWDWAGAWNGGRNQQN